MTSPPHPHPPQLSDKGTSPQSGVWGARFKDLHPLVGGRVGLLGTTYPEKKAPSWADRSTVTAPHRGRGGGGWFLFLGLFFFCNEPCGDGQGGVRCGAVAGGAHMEEG